MVSKILVYGGRGALGSNIIANFRKKGFWICSLDFGENSEANVSVVIKASESLVAQSSQVLEDTAKFLGSDKVDAVICVAGGWAGGNVISEDFVKNIELVTKQSIFTSVIASQLAAKFGKSGSLLVLTGADAALKPTPSMIGYGMMKAAVHHFTGSLSKDESLPQNLTVLAILPVILDTPMNRKWMPNADTSTWTPLGFISELFLDWINNKESRPNSGSLVRLHTLNCITEIKLEEQ